MNARTEVRILRDAAGEPAFAVIPFAEIEASKRPRKATRMKIDEALGIAPERLDF